MKKSEIRKKHRKTSDKKKLLWLSAASVVVVALIIGLSYAWFFNQSDMATLIPIKTPSDISILGPGGSEIASLDLNYTDDDITVDETTGKKKVTIKRVFCVQTQAMYHRLEIVHTTNMEGLTFKLYPVISEGTESVTDGGIEYTYSSTAIEGRYINQGTSNGEYKYANKVKHDINYGEYTYVQSHAEPLYWLANEKLEARTADQETWKSTVTIDNKPYNRTYYVLEISWTETTKETDIFYILAEDASDEQQSSTAQSQN